ncbi:MAG TPA: peptidoglycan-binding domain-containing protein [Jatrophihabitans sp.]|jgi:peptidoglycan hydrolase-like protein with peptidoglycan-binding domain
MNGTADSRADDHDNRVEIVQRGCRLRRAAIIAAVVVLIAAGAVAAVRAFTARRGGGSGAEDDGFATSLATVERRSLSTRTQFPGTLGYAGFYLVLARANGTVTWLPAPGQVIENGQVLYRLDGSPVVLLSGETPAYRTLEAGTIAADVTGADVAQLNHDLVALGYARPRDVAPAWDQFSWATRAGVRRLQKHLGVEQTGRLDLGAVVFLPTPTRVSALQAHLGGPATGRVLQATSTTRSVSVALDAGLQSEVNRGDPVTITLPDGSTTSGTVASVGRVATVASNDPGSGTSSGATVPVAIRPARPAQTGSFDQAQVEVSIIDRTVHNVLAVPVDALVALAGGGYAAEAVAGDGTHHLVRVIPGLFDDGVGMVQVSTAGLTAGQRVVVPGNA